MDKHIEGSCAVADATRCFYIVTPRDPRDFGFIRSDAANVPSYEDISDVYARIRVNEIRLNRGYLGRSSRSAAR